MKQTSKWLFAASVGVNILLVGFVAGRLAHPHGRMMPPPPMPHLSEKWVATLPQDKQQLLKDIMQKIRMQQKEDFSKADDMRKELIEVVTAPEFDKQAFLNKSRSIGEVFFEGKRHVVEQVADVLGKFSQDERRALAKNLLKGPPRPPEWDKPAGRDHGRGFGGPDFRDGPPPEGAGAPPPPDGEKN